MKKAIITGLGLLIICAASGTYSTGGIEFEDAFSTKLKRLGIAGLFTKSA